jgi:hypothetical protein
MISSKVPWILQNTDTADSTSASTPTTTTVYIGTSAVQSCSPATTVFTGSTTTTTTTTVQNCSPTVPTCQSISVLSSTIVPAAEPDCGRHRSFSGPDRNSS